MEILLKFSPKNECLAPTSSVMALAAANFVGRKSLRGLALWVWGCFISYKWINGANRCRQQWVRCEKTAHPALKQLLADRLDKKAVFKSVVLKTDANFFAIAHFPFLKF
jgi:hypothetical protein